MTLVDLMFLRIISLESFGRELFLVTGLANVNFSFVIM